jgi:hypothetical protein
LVAALAASIGVATTVTVCAATAPFAPAAVAFVVGAVDYVVDSIFSPSTPGRLVKERRSVFIAGFAPRTNF